jgi:hypothetical protein
MRCLEILFSITMFLLFKTVVQPDLKHDRFLLSLSFLDDVMTVCKNCSAPVTEKFCGRCGEKVYTETDKSFKHLFEEAFHFMTHFEGKFFTTLGTILRRPGKLSLDFCNGIRKKYFKPLSFYLLLIIAYLLFPVFEGLNMQLKYYYSAPIYGTYAKEKAEEVREKKGYTEEKMTEVFHQKGEKTSKFLLFILIPFTALFSYAFGFWKRKFYFDHFIFSTEVVSFFLFYGFLLLPLLVVLTNVIGLRIFRSEDILGIVIYTGVSVYASLAAGRFFQFRKIVNVLYGLLFSVALLTFIQYAYKFILFNIVIRLVG